MLNPLELETTELMFEVFDHNALFANEVIGYVSVGISTMYRHINHEFYRTWIPLLNSEEGAEVQGKLQISCYVIGPGEKQPAHALDEVYEDEEYDDDLGAEISEAKKKELQEKKKGIYIMKAPKLFSKFYSMNISILKIEGYPEDTSGKGLTTYCSARVMGNTLITNSIRDNSNPLFNCKLRFPVYLPILNDKIIIKVWVEHSRTSVEHYANIPEIPKQDDCFNISVLQGKEGLMPSQWFNLYGTKLEDRSYFYSASSAYYLEGSSFMGRALIGMSINSTKTPELMKGSANLVREPEFVEYTLIVEPYEISNITETEDKDVRIHVTFGLYTDFTKSIHYDGKNKNYKFKARHRIDPIKANYPKKIDQVPDVIVTLQSQTMFGSKWNVGYFRVPASQLGEEKLKWYKFKSLGKPHSSPGKILCNLHLTTEKFIKKNLGKKPSIKVAYMMYCKLFYSLDVSTEQKDETKIISWIKVKVSGHNLCKTEEKSGHHPIWNTKSKKKLDLSKDLNYEQDLTLTLFQKGYFGAENEVGEINIPLISVMKGKCEPRFYQFKSFGESKGKLLAMFGVKELEDKGVNSTDFEETMNSKLEVREKADIKLSIIGIRNLASMTNTMKMDVELIHLKEDKSIQSNKITTSTPGETPKEEEKKESIKKKKKMRMDSSDEEDDSLPSDDDIGIKDKKDNLERQSVHPELIQQIKEQEEGKGTANYDTENTKREDEKEEEDEDEKKYNFVPTMPDPTTCPNFLKTFSFTNIPFSNDPLLWPIVSIRVTDDAYFASVENLHLMFPLINFCDFITPIEKEKSMKRIENAYRIKARPLDDSVLVSDHKESDSSEGEDSSEDEESESDSLPEEKENEQTNANKDEEEGEGEGEGSDKSHDSKDKSIKKKDGFWLFGKKKKDNKEEEVDDDDFDRLIHKEDPALFEKYTKRIKNIMPKSLKDRIKDKAQINIYDTLNVDEDEIVTLEATDIDKDYEYKIREKRIAKNEKELTELEKDLRSAVTDKTKSYLRNKMLMIRRRIELLENEDMPEDKFWNYQNNDDSEFEYGRNVLHDKTLDFYLDIPYLKMEMKPMPEMCFDTIGHIDARNKASDGYEKRFIKLKVSVNTRDESHKILDDDNTKKFAKDTDDQYVSVKTRETIVEFPFNILEDEFMNFIKEQEPFICRVYVLRCQNLTAASSSVGIKDRLAGYSANCTATPYLVLTVGEGKDKSNIGAIKTINGREYAQEHTLSPDIYQVYEFSILFPEDWILKIEVKDASGYIADSLIGQTSIDLEDRYFGDPHLTLRRTLEIYKRQYKKRITGISGKSKENKQMKKDLEEIHKKIILKISDMNKTQLPKLPVEFRELSHPDKKQSQGIIEMWAEIFPEKESKLHPPSVIKPPARDIYEIRLIVWETKDIVLADGDHVDIYIKVMFNPNGWSQEEISKATDIHYNSQDGRGEFNYRMKFPLELPCEFPRLKIQVYDYGTLGNTIIGENTLNMTNTIKQLKKEGKIQTDNLLLNLTNPDDANEDVGSLKLSMTVLSKMEADSAPVGEAWDEPNEHPRLTQPTEGRGLGDRFASMGFGLGGWGFPSWWIIMKYAAIVAPMIGILGMMGAMLLQRAA